MDSASHTCGGTSVEVLREMVRLAENNRNEQLKMLDRVNQYNMAVIAFSGAFLSLLVSLKFSKITVETAGAFLLISVTLSLIALAPRHIKGGNLIIDDDVSALRSGKHLDLGPYLLETADLTEKAVVAINELGRRKRLWTIFSAVFLALALLTAYITFVYA